MKIYFLPIIAILAANTVSAQVGINNQNPTATLDIVAKTTTGSTPEGIIIPRISKEKAYEMAPDADISNAIVNPVGNSTLVYIDDLTLTTTATGAKSTDNITSTGFYFYQTNTKRWQPIYNKNNFYYSPTIVLPTNSDDTRLGTYPTSNYTYNSTSGVYTVYIYNIFKNQFENPVVTSSPTNPTLSLREFVKSATDYSYFVTYFDNNVFQDVTFDVNGVLQYKVKANSIIRNGSFMNIILKEN